MRNSAVILYNTNCQFANFKNVIARKHASQHGKEIKIIERYKLRFHKILNNNVRRWNCTNKKCKAYFKIGESGDTVIENKLDHNHEKDVQDIMVRQVIRNSLKRKAQDEICERPLKLIHHELRKLTQIH